MIMQNKTIYKKMVLVISFNIGVNVIGLPEVAKHYLNFLQKEKTTPIPKTFYKEKLNTNNYGKKTYF